MTRLLPCLVFAPIYILGVGSNALAASTFVSGGGSDSNDCSLAAPCRSMGRAITQAGVDGAVSCLDSSDFTALTTTITASVTIDCAGTAATAGPFLINGGLTVTIRNLTVRNNLVGMGDAAISVQGGNELIVENAYVSGPGNGIFFYPSGTSHLAVFNTKIRREAPSTRQFFATAGIYVQPSGAGVALADLDNVRIEGCGGGIYAWAGAGAQTSLTVKQSQISFNDKFGVAAQSGGGVVKVDVDGTMISNNKDVGLYSGGDQAWLYVSRSTITENNIGWAFGAGGNLVSYQDNYVSLNQSTFGGPSFTATRQ